jgi:hypothetical protein
MDGAGLGCTALRWAALARAHHADALDQLRRRAAALGQESIGAMRALAGPHRIAGEDHRHLGRDLFQVADQLVAIHLRQAQIGQHQIDHALRKRVRWRLAR